MSAAPPRAGFISDLVDGVIIVEDDNDGAMSVTNDIEAVVLAMTRRYGRPHGPMIYRDTLGAWDGVAIEDGQFRGFIGLNGRTRDKAMIGIALYNAEALAATLVAQGVAPPCFSISGVAAAREAFARSTAAFAGIEP